MTRDTTPHDEHEPQAAEGIPVDADPADTDRIDADLEREYGFEPAVAATGAEPDRDAPSSSTTTATTPSPSSSRPRGRLFGGRPSRRPATGRPAAKASTAAPTTTAASSAKTHDQRRSLSRRLSAAGVLLAALVAMGAGYASFASASSAQASSQGDIAAGQQLYQTSCIACHGANLQGVNGRGPSLIAAGGASVYFQVSTGRMPLAGQGAAAIRKPSKFTEQQIQQLAAYVQSIGGGPQVPTGNLRDADIAEGGDLFRTNCASCHGTTGKGAPLSAGKVAPGLTQATDAQIYTAMLSGPESMPVFSDNELTPTQKKQIIAYIQTLKASADPGGNGIDRIGPVSEAVVIWVAGVGALMVAILWIGAKSQ